MNDDLVSFSLHVASWIASGAMVFGGIVPYVPQYRHILRTNSAEGFSLHVCLVLLVANILRIFFWFGNYYELPLLAQSIIMIITMLSLVRLCVRVNANSEVSQRRRAFTDFDFTYFWKWTKFRDYLEFLLFFSLLVGMITYYLLDVYVYVQLLGFCSLLLEALLGLPQLYKNCVSGSTEGMSTVMVLCWTSGDFFKTGYFLVRKAPEQFWLCGMLQVTVDIGILLQVAFYRNRLRQLAIVTQHSAATQA